MAYIGNTADQQAFTPAIDYFNGDGSTVAFTLSRIVASVAQVQAVIENVPQNPGDAFTVSGNTITFTSAPPIGTNNIYVYYTSPITQLSQPGQGTVSPTSLSTGGPYWNLLGNVGVGTTNPAPAGGVNLQLGDRSNLMHLSINNGLYFGNNLYYDGSTWRYNQTGAGSFINLDSGLIGFGNATSGTAGTVASSIVNRMGIDASGNLLVGTTSSNWSANGHIESTSGYACKAGQVGAFSGNGFNINWTGSSAILWIDSTNIGAIQTSSDYRIKRNIETQTAPALERVMALRPVTYQMADYKDGLFKASEDIKEGFIAHEVQEVIPSGADGEKDAENQIQSLRVDAILSVAVKAIQEQQAIIEDLKARIETLESK